MDAFSTPISLPQVYIYLITTLGSFAVAIITTPAVRAIALRYGRVDTPCARKVHVQPMARLGGIAICLGTVVALLLALTLGALQKFPDSNLNSLFIVLIGSLGAFAIGLSDDLFMLSPTLRLLMQFGVASLVWYQGVRIEFLTLPGIGMADIGLLSLPVTVIWLVGVVNAINWIDGLDGLATGVSGIAAATSGLICFYTGQLSAALILLALLGSLLGFLVFNFNPARIFMGDGGSYFIGFLLAGVSITGLVKSATATAILLPILVLAVPLIDMSAVIFGRLRRGKSPFLADNSHLHHRLLKAGVPHRLTVLVIYSIAFWLGSLALVFVGLPKSLFIVGSASGLLIFMALRARHMARKIRESS